MIKRIKLLFLVSILFPFVVNAQHDVNINAIGLFFQNYGLGYEYVINEGGGAGIDFNYATSKIYNPSKENNSYSSFSISPNYKFYFSPDYGADGYYFEAYLKYKTTTDGLVYSENTGSGYETHAYDLKSSGLGLGIALGKKRITNSGSYMITLFGIGRFVTQNFSFSDADVEAMVKKNNPNYKDVLSKEFLYTWDFRVHLGVGWRFGGY